MDCLRSPRTRFRSWSFGPSTASGSSSAVVGPLELDDLNIVRIRTRSPAHASSDDTIAILDETKTSDGSCPCAPLEGSFAPPPSGNSATPSHVVARPPLGACPRHGVVAEEGSKFKFEPVSPEDMQARRYDERHSIPQNPPEQISTIKPMKITFEYQKLPLGWTACRHPEGHLYFHHKAQGLYTDIWIYDEATCHDIERCGDTLRHELQNEPNCPNNTEIVMQVWKGEDGVRHCKYYLACEDSRAIFWLHEAEVRLLSQNVLPICDESHLQDAKEAQYWIHVDLYPLGREITMQLLDELNDLMVHQRLDAYTSETSTAPYSTEESSILSQVLQDARPGMHAASMCSIARIMYILAWERFMNFHGQKCARLERNISVYEHSNRSKRSNIFAFMSPLLFYTPDLYIEELEKIWVDNYVNHKPWNTFVSGLQVDWENTILPATVLLTANVGFLAIQSVDTQRPSRSFAQITSYLSTLFSLGNIIMCTILARQHRLSAHGTAAEAANYLARRSDTFLGLELLAITFSLPGALFLWGMLLFYASVSWICFFDTSAATTISAAVILAFISILTTVVVAVDWRTGPPEESVWHRFSASVKHSLRRRLLPWLKQKHKVDAEHKTSAVSWLRGLLNRRRAHDGLFTSDPANTANIV